MKKRLTIICTMIGLLFLGTGTVAYFSSVVNGNINGTTSQINLNVTGLTDEVNKIISLGSIGPGDEGEFTLNFNLNGSGMDVICTIDFARTNLPNSLLFFFDENHNDILTKHTFYIEKSAPMTSSLTVYWYWNEKKDNENDSLFMNTNINTNIIITAEQLGGGSMKNGAMDETEFWNSTYRDSIETITLKDTTKNVPTTCNQSSLCWDISSSPTQEKHVYAYLETNDNSLYDLYIACERKIYAPVDSKDLFAGFGKLKRISLNNLLNTSPVVNMQGMFAGGREDDAIILDSQLKNTVKPSLMGNVNAEVMYNGSGSDVAAIDLIGFDTSNVTNMSYMFYKNEVLNSLDLSSFDTSNVTDMAYMFDDCFNLTSLDLSSFNTSNVTNMDSMFSNCTDLTILDVSSFNTSKVTNMKTMFFCCLNLTSLDVSGFNTSNVTNMSQMFGNCSSLTNLNVSGFNTSNVTNMYDMFYGCSSLTSLDVSSFNTSNVTNIGYMFGNCYNLEFEDETDPLYVDISHFDLSNTDYSAEYHNSVLCYLRGGCMT